MLSKFRVRVVWAFVLGAAFLAVGAEPTPAPVPSAADLVDRWRRAVSASPRDESVVHVASRSNEDGISGSIDEWIAPDGDYRRRTARDPDRSEVVVTGKFARRRDWNGFLRRIEGRELERLKSEISERAAIAVGPTSPSPGASVERMSDGRLIFRETPAGGREIVWTIDAQTDLPIQSVRPGDDTEITTTYSDWRNTGGRKLPYREHVAETDKPYFEIRLRAVRADSPGGAFDPPAAGPTDVRLLPDGRPTPFTLESNHIVFPVSVNGRPPIGFILDTGADQEVLNTTRLDAFGLSPYATTATSGGGNSAEYDYVKDATLTLPGVELVRQHVAAIDETGLERALGIPLGGLLGFDFISRFVVEIDYEKKLITLHDPVSWKYAGPGAVVPLVFDGGIPFMHGTISAGGKDIPALLVLDFGAAETMTLTAPFVKAHGLDALSGNPVVNRPAGMEKEFFAQNNIRGRVDRLALGGFVVDAIPINMSVNTSGAYSSTSFAGTVGETIYSRYHVFLDYFRRRAIFEETASSQEPFPQRRTYGLSLLASGPDLRTYTVSAVRAGSPAEKDTFRKGDRVVAWDGESSSTFTLSQLRDRLSREGERHTVTVARAGARVEIPISVRLVSIETPS